MTRIWYEIRINRCSCLHEISRVAGAPDSHLVQRIRAEKQHLLAAQMHNHVKSHWSMHRHMARLSVVCRGALIWHVDSLILPLGFSSTLDLAPQIVPLRSCYSGWAKKRRKKEKKGSGAQRMHKTVATFVFWEKKKIKVFLFCCVQGFHENRQRSNLLFSLRESRGALIFSLPIQEWIIIVRLPWVTTQRSSVPRFTFKWNQMAVHSGMIYSNDDGNKSKVLFHIGLGCYLGLLSFGDFAGTVGELCLCYVKTITFAFQRVDSSTRCLTDLM